MVYFLRTRLFLLFFLIMLTATAVRAAELTDVHDAADGKDPWDGSFEVTYGFKIKWASIYRESYDSVNQQTYQRKELDFKHFSHTMNIRFRFGLYKDLETFVNIPFVMQWQNRVTLAPGVVGTCQGTDVHPPGDPNLSSIISDGLFRGGGIPSNPVLATHYAFDPNTGQPIPNPIRTYGGGPCTGGDSGVPGQSDRAGIGDISIGFRWGLLNNERDASKPTWVLSVAYTIPSGQAMNPDHTDTGPNNDYSPSNRGVGLGVHRLTFGMYFSKRIAQYFDPYVAFEYSLAIPPSGDTLFRRTVVVDGTKQYDNQEYAGPGHRAGFIVGTEFVPFERPDTGVKIAIDVRFRAQLQFEGRDYSEIADFLGRVTDIQQYGSYDLSLGIYARPHANIFMRLSLGVAFEQRHFITFASIGVDRTGPQGNPNGVVDNDVKEQNPTYDPLTDSIGKRLLVGDTAIFKFDFAFIVMW